jgi:lysyl-tRNA synthetase class 2
VEESRIRILKLRHLLVSAVRRFFDERAYVEVDTPSLVFHPAVDAHVDALEAEGGRFLITSPEIHMKMLLVDGLQRIYQIGHAFRAGESGPWHNPEFTMLEWYRTGASYLDLMDEAEQLVLGLAAAAKTSLPSPFPRLPVCRAFVDRAGWDPARSWDEDRFFLDLVDKVEPSLRREPAVFLYDYPAPVAAMARIKDTDPLLCERFELYVRGVEIANGYSELADADEQKARFARENARRKAMGKRAYPVDESFIASLRRGLPPCSGIALGLDRLLACLLEIDGLKGMMAYPEESLKKTT